MVIPSNYEDNRCQNRNYDGGMERRARTWTRRPEIRNSRTVVRSGADLWQIRELGPGTHVSSGITRRVPIMNTYKDGGRRGPPPEEGKRNLGYESTYLKCKDASPLLSPSPLTQYPFLLLSLRLGYSNRRRCVRVENRVFAGAHDAA